MCVREFDIITTWPLLDGMSNHLDERSLEHVLVYVTCNVGVFCPGSIKTQVFLKRTFVNGLSTCG